MTRTKKNHSGGQISEGLLCCTKKIGFYPAVMEKFKHNETEHIGVLKQSLAQQCGGHVGGQETESGKTASRLFLESVQVRSD